MNALKLNKRTIEQIPVPDKDTFFWDCDLKGFGLKAYKSGKRSFILQTRLNGESRRYTIGVYGQPWSPDQAREAAIQILADVAKGIDPAAKKKALREATSVAEFWRDYQRDAMGHKKPSTKEVEEGLMKRHILPLLGRKKVKDLTRVDLQRFIQNVADGKTAADEKTKRYGRAIVKGGKGTANRTMALLSSMLTHAVQVGLRADNPAKGVKKFTLKKHDRYLNSQELERLGDALRHAELEGQSRFAIAAIRFLLLSGCRSGEALSLQWNWIDFDHNIAKLPDSKTGQKVLLLGSGAMEILKTLDKVQGSPLVFPSAAGGATPISIQKVWRKVRTAACLGELRLHDLRHNFASAAVSSGQSLYVVGKLLGHSQSQTTQRYAHLAPDPIRQAADDVAGKLAQRIAGSDRSQTSSLNSHESA